MIEPEPGLGPRLAVSAVIVSYHTREKLARCLRALEDVDDVIVVDNASTDGSPEMIESEFPRARLIRNRENVGFGRANNQGIEMARHGVVLLINSDCYAAPGAVARLQREFADPDTVAVGGKLLNPDGSLQESIAGPLSLAAVLWEQTYLDALWRRVAPGIAYWRTREALKRAGDGTAGDGTAEVDQVMGACLMFRPVETFDERFFLYTEDTELCRRLAVHGKIRYVPEAEFIHELGTSSASRRWLAVARYNRGKELYFRLHHGVFAEAACLVLDRLGALLRLIVWLPLSLVPRWRGQPGLFWRVLTVPRRGPDFP